MGWSYCGTNPDTLEEMGYSIRGVCHQTGCNKMIDHGLAYVCGGMHQGGEQGCGYYFCDRHLIFGDNAQLCAECFEEKTKEVSDYEREKSDSGKAGYSRVRIRDRFPGE